MMKIRSLVFVSIFVFCSSTFAQNDASELTKLLNDFLAGAGKNDVAMHDRFWADDLIYTRSAGVRTNKEELMKGVRSAPPKKEGDPSVVYTAEDVKIQQYGNTAVVAFRLVSTTTKADGTKSVGNNLNTGTFVKRKGEWRAVAWQSTIVPPPHPTTAQTETKADAAKPAAAAVTSTTETASSNSDSSDRKYIKGPRGGCYYMNASGAKVYVDKKYCP
jgi:ketosteroid isomerase-like protein